MAKKDKALATTNPPAPIEKISFTADQIALITRTLAPTATPDELQLFLYQAKRTGLDPLARQIYLIKRKQSVMKNGVKTWIEKAGIQASIDGLRVVAERSGDYAGQDEPAFTETNGQLVKAKVTVYRFSKTGERYPAAVGVAYWSEYCPPPPQDMMWRKMPHTMLAKVAEALALRKAYPQDLSGIYSQEEMEQAEPAQEREAPTMPPKRVMPPKPTPIATAEDGEVVENPPTPEEPAPPQPEPEPVAEPATKNQMGLITKFISQGRVKPGDEAPKTKAEANLVIKAAIDTKAGTYAK